MHQRILNLHTFALLQRAAPVRIAAVDALLLLDCALAHTIKPAIAAQSLTSVSAAMLAQQLSSLSHGVSTHSRITTCTGSSSCHCTAQSSGQAACGNCSYEEVCAWRHDQTKEFAAALAGWANAEPHCVAAQPSLRTIQQTLAKWDVQTIEDIGDPAPMEESSEWSHVRTAALAQWWNCRVETTLARTQRDRGTNTEPNTPSGFRAQMLAVWDTLRVCAALPSGGPFDLDAAGVRVADGTIFILPKCTVCLKHSDESKRAQSFKDNQSAVTGLIVDTPTCETPGLRVAASLGAFHQAHVQGSIAGSSNDKLVRSLFWAYTTSVACRMRVMGITWMKSVPLPPRCRPDAACGVVSARVPELRALDLDMLLPLSTELPLVAAAALRLAEEAGRGERVCHGHHFLATQSRASGYTGSSWKHLQQTRCCDSSTRAANQPKLTVDVVVTTLDDAQRT